MSLWIRSQDGCDLTEVRSLDISQSGDYYSIFGDKEDYPLGSYKTEERALEILDEIQKILIQPIAFLKLDIPQDFSQDNAKKYCEQIDEFCHENNLICLGSTKCDITPLNTNNIVYNMPKE